MGRILPLVVILAIGVLWFGAFGESSHVPVRNRRNAFILRKCIASAELRRRTGPHSVRDPIAKEESGEARKENLSDSRRENWNSPVEKNQQRKSQARENETEEEKLIVHLKNTPLTTVDIKTLRNRSPAFKKKSLLPELRRSASSRTVGPSQNIILIKPVN